jgi:hypothetical protein
MGQIKAKTHLEKLGFSETDKKQPKHDIIQKWVQNNIENIIANTYLLNNEHPFKIRSVVWEMPVNYINGNYKMLVGFVDIVAHFTCKIFNKFTNELEDVDRYAYIEVKTQIPSLGELIRQMRAYQNYKQDDRVFYMIISSDDTHIDTLKTQGFYFYKYQDSTKLF